VPHGREPCEEDDALGAGFSEEGPSGKPMISALVLAAGASSRMGEPKPLLSLDGRPVLAHVLAAVAGSRVTETIVVVGAASERVRKEVPRDGARWVENPAFAEGMSSSLRAGVAALSPESDGFFVVLGDEPFVRSSTYDALIAARERTGARIVLPTYGGVRGNPVLIDRTLASEVDAITGDRGCRALRLRHPKETVEVPVDDPGVVIDLDTPEDLARVRRALASGEPLSGVARELVREDHPLAPSTAAPRGRTRGRPDVLAIVGELERQREPFCLAIVTRVQAPTSGKPGFKAIVRPDGSVVGWVGGSCSRHALVSEARAALEEGEPRLLRLRPGTEACPPRANGVVDRVMECQSGGAMDIYIEPHGPPPQLIVVGDTPVAESLTALGRLLGFRVVAAGVGLDPSRFPDADEIVGNLPDLSEKVDAATYAVVATMAQYDGMALEILLRSPAEYVGLVASRRRAETLREDLRAHGVSEEALERIRNPAGINVGARTPEEIAVSVAAEIVEVRRKSPRTPPSTEAAPTAPATVATDPVCHMEVDPVTTLLRSTHGDTTYYFCSEGCLRRFEATPDAFLQ
jgi:xanthine dehydrogenase accessory factor